MDRGPAVEGVLFLGAMPRCRVQLVLWPYPCLSQDNLCQRVHKMLVRLMRTICAAARQMTLDLGKLGCHRAKCC